MASGHRNRVGKDRDGARFMFWFGYGSECSDGFNEGSDEDAESVKDKFGDADAEGEVGGQMFQSFNFIIYPKVQSTQYATSFITESLRGA
ncbi:uncharacterized protein G2W53_026767 [Senna tora]|uniref:Uncharacterized protein n=1 Tax=Senna tora TaxID=362788 RepID=A0A834THJ6_9FABA|nr:uncharacterized protein G2W53_026767 [Senna tora]